MAAGRRTPGRTKAFVIVAAAAFLLFAALPTATLLTVGMAPTLVAAIVDVTRGRYLTKCVAGMNFAGVVPFLFRLLSQSHDLQTALAIVSDAFAWLVMYSAAGMGWLLFLGLPGLVSMARVLNAKRRIYGLQEKQKALLNEWGDGILPTSEGPGAEQAEAGGGDAPRDAEPRPRAAAS